MRKKATRPTRRQPSDDEAWVRMLVRVRREDLEHYRRAAARAGLNVSEWARSVLDRASRTPR